MKKIILATIILFVPFMLAAQDVLYLKNGSVVSGEILEKKENGGVKIRTSNGREVEYSQFDIREISEGAKRGERVKARQYVSYEDRSTGYFFAAEASILGSLDEKGGTLMPIGLSVVNGYRASEFFSAGIGVGLRYYSGSADTFTKKNLWAFPFYLDVRGNLVSHRGRNVVPFWSLDIGYPIGDDHKMFFAPTLGVSIGDYRNNFIVGLTYMGQFIDRRGGDNNNILDMVGLKVGFQF